MHKSRSSYRDGYKAHVAVEPSTGLITACDLTPANEGDGPTGIALLADEAKGLDVLADSAYGSGDSLAKLDDAEHGILIKPWPLARNKHLGDDQLNRDDFIIDYIARTVNCPNGTTTHITDKGSATFGTKCQGCPVRSRCTGIDGEPTPTSSTTTANTGRWSSAPSHGSSPRPPPRATPRRRTQQDRLLHPSRRRQPQTTDQPRPRPQRHDLEPRLDQLTGPTTIEPSHRYTRTSGPTTPNMPQAQPDRADCSRPD